MRIVLYQPEIAQNTGTIMRMCACLKLPLAIVEPCGFVFNSPKFKRSVMDYITDVDIQRYDSWEEYLGQNTNRLLLLTPHTKNSYYDFQFQQGDQLILGQESSGVPQSVFEQIEHHLKIPMPGGGRSLNVAVAGAMVASEALRQILDA